MRAAHLPPAGWVPNAAALLAARPDLDGIGWTGALDSLVTA